MSYSWGWGYSVSANELLKGGYIGDYIGEYYRAYYGDTRSLDYGSYEIQNSWEASERTERPARYCACASGERAQVPTPDWEVNTAKGL